MKNRAERLLYFSHVAERIKIRSLVSTIHEKKTGAEAPVSGSNGATSN